MMDGRRSMVDDRSVDLRRSMVDDRRSMCRPSEIDTIIIAVMVGELILCKQNLINLVWSVPYCMYDVEQ